MSSSSPIARRWTAGTTLRARAMTTPAPATASVNWSRRVFSAALRPSMRTPAAAPTNTNPAHGKSVKLVRPGVGRKYHSTGSGSHPSSGAVRTMGVSSEMAAAASSEQRAPRSPAPRHSTGEGCQRHRRPHDVENVDLQQAERAEAAAENVRLETEQERETEYLPSTRLGGPPRRGKITCFAELRLRRQHDGYPCKKQKQRRAKSSKDHRIAEQAAACDPQHASTHRARGPRS